MIKSYSLPVYNETNLADILKAGDDAKIKDMTDEEIKECRHQASEHNAKTGFQKNSGLALACGLELKKRQNKLKQLLMTD
jgi:hypothetical protein